MKYHEITFTLLRLFSNWYYSYSDNDVTSRNNKMLTDIATSEDLENDNLKSSRREGRFAWYYMTTTLTSTSTSTSYSTTYTSMPLNLDFL